MTEDFLHHLWKHQFFDRKDLLTTEGQVLEIMQNGFLNRDAGPDFSEAQTIIDGQRWAGQVEIHCYSSEWKQHGHHLDPAYQAVILHVVYEDDQPVKRPDGSYVPCLELKGRFDEYPFWRYQQLLSNQGAIACHQEFKRVDHFFKEAMLERCGIERLEQKAHAMQALLGKLRGDWDEAFYRALAWGFGLRVNAEPMLQLSKNLPSALWQRRLSEVEPLFFGAAGLLAQAPEDPTVDEWRKQWRFLAHKYRLNEMEPQEWKYARLRPAAFPDFRLALFCALLKDQSSLWQKIRVAKDAPALEKLLDVKASDYWHSHYRLGKFSARAHSAQLGRATRQLLIINVLAPFIFLYGKMLDRPEHCEKALYLLESLPAENNRITRVFKDLDLALTNASDSQAAIQWFKKYCEPKKCLNCRIGNQLIKS
jgi:hypothetical protein